MRLLRTNNFRGGLLVPSLNLDFTQGVLPQGLSFSRASTATYFDVNGVMQTAGVGQARFDYDPVSHAALGLLIEEQRTNSTRYSNDFTNGAWTKSDTSVSSGFVSPDGNSNACLVTEGSAGTASLSQAVTLVSGNQYTFSIFLKRGNHDWVRIQAGDIAIVWFNFATGLIGTTSNQGAGTYQTSKVTAYPNGWFRVQVTGISGPNGAIFYTISANGDNSVNRYANGARYQWGAQLEQGAFSTSLIQTTSTTATRGADVCSLTVGSWLNQNESSWLAEFQGGRNSTQDGYGRVLGVNNTNIQLVASNGPSGNSVGVWPGSGSTLSINLTPVVVFSQFVKVAMAYNNITRLASLVNGSTIGKATLGGSYPAITFLQVGSQNGSSNFLNGYIRKLTYYPRVLPDSTLQLLTQ